METKTDYKKAFTGMKTLDDISHEIESMDFGADIGFFTIDEAKEVLKTKETIVKKSVEHGIPDKILDENSAKKLLLQRHRINQKQIEKCQEVVGNCLFQNDCKLEGEFVIDDKMYGIIVRAFSQSKGVMTIKLEQDKIFIRNK